MCCDARVHLYLHVSAFGAALVKKKENVTSFTFYGSHFRFTVFLLCLIYPDSRERQLNVIVSRIVDIGNRQP